MDDLQRRIAALSPRKQRQMVKFLEKLEQEPEKGKCIGPGGDCGPAHKWRRSEPYGWYGMVACPVHVPDDPLTIELRQMIRDAGKGYLLDTEEFLEVYPHLRCEPPDEYEGA